MGWGPRFDLLAAGGVGAEGVQAMVRDCRGGNFEKEQDTDFYNSTEVKNSSTFQ